MDQYKREGKQTGGLGGAIPEVLSASSPQASYKQPLRGDAR